MTALLLAWSVLTTPTEPEPVIRPAVRAIARGHDATDREAAKWWNFFLRELRRRPDLVEYDMAFEGWA